MDEKTTAPFAARKRGLRQLLCQLLVAVQLWQPFFNFSYAGEVVPSSAGTSLNQSANGAPVVNIAKPGAAGISHNSYTQFDVSNKGLILNNSAQPVNTQLGGYVMGNANVAGGSARLILNEVTAANPSQLNGYMEVAGQKADVIVANPWGITCKGCGFINTAKATLTTGKPFLNNDGSLGGFDVQGGTLRIDGAGLNASNTERLALYARVLELNAALYAKDLQALAGSNRINTDGSYSAQPSVDTAPAYSIDSSALGGMYANTITLVGTEAGVGMRLSGPVAALTGKLEITSNGDVRLIKGSAAQSASVSAAGNLELASDGSTERGGLSTGAALTLKAGDTLSLSGDSTLTGAATTITAQVVDAASGSDIAARGNLAITAASQHYQSTVGSQGHITLAGETIDNQGRLLAGTGLVVTGSSLRNAGSLQSQQGDASLVLSGLFDNQAGQLQSGGTLTLDVAQLDNTQGRIASEGMLSLATDSTLNNQHGLLQGNAGVIVTAASLDNRHGQIVSNAGIDLTLPSGLDNRDGLVETPASISLVQSVTLANSTGILRTGHDLNLYLPAFDQAQSGGLFSAYGLLRLETTGDITLGAQALETPGSLRLVSAQGDIAFMGRVISGGDVFLMGQHINVGDDGVLVGQGQLTASAEALNNLGVIYGRDSVTLALANSLDNGAADGDHAAALLSDGDIRITSAGDVRLARISNYAGLIESRGGDITLKADQLENINLGWSVTSGRTLPEYSYSPGQNYWDTYYFHGNSGDSNKLAYRYTTFTDYYVVDQGAPARIIADGQSSSIFIEADKVLNDRSVISSSSMLDMKAGLIINNGTRLTDITTKKTDYRYHWCKTSTGHGEKCHNEAGSLADEYTPGDSHVIPAILEGGTAVALHGTVVNGVAEQITKTARIDDGDYTGLDTTPSGQPVSGAQPPNVLDPTANPGFHLPGNGIFHLSLPGHAYLVETDPALNSYTGFLGSGYLIGQLSWQPGVTQRRLGDSYYELMLIRDALQASIGSRFIDPAIADEKAQYEYLMQNAIAASESLQLTPGIALSREQIDALQQDIVWMEERNIAGEKVLVPVVYLAQGSSRLLQDGAVIGGGSLAIEAGSMDNGGLIRARDKLDIITTGDLSNHGGSIVAGGDLSLQSGNDIRNESGHISGSNVLLQAEGDIIHRTVSQRDDFDVGGTQSWATRVGKTASVSATGKLEQVAGGDIRLTAARLSGNSVMLEAGHDVILDTVKNEQGYRFNDAAWQVAEEHVRHLTSTLEAAQSLSISAGQDITAIAARIKAGGDATVTAGRSISLLAAEETDYVETHSQHKGSFNKRETYDSVDDASRMHGSLLAADGNLSISAAAGNVLLYASQAQAGQEMEVSAAGNISLIAGVDTTQHSVTQSKSNAATFKNHQEGYVEQTAVGSAMAAGGNLRLNAGGDVNLIASDLKSDASLYIGNAELEKDSLRSRNGTPLNLNVSTLALTNESWNETQKGLKGPLESVVKILSVVGAQQLAIFSAGQLELPEVTIGEHESTRSRQTLQAGSSLWAKDDLQVKVQDTAAFIGADVAVGKTLRVSAQDIVIDAVAESSTYRHESGKDSVKGLEADLDKDKGEYRVGGVQETKTSISDTQSITQWRGTNFNAGQLILEAENNIDILGSQLNVIGDAKIKAGEQLTIGGREGNLTQEHKETTEVITVAVAIRNAYVDAVQAVQGLGDAADALKAAKQALSEAERKVKVGQLDESDLSYFRVNLVAAAANLAQAEVASAAAMAPLLQGSATYGFYASGSASREKTTTTSSSSQTFWQGSDLKIGGNASLTAGDKITVQGSDIAVTQALAVNAKQIELLAGEERSQQTSRTTQEHEGVQVSANVSGLSGGGVNIGLRSNEADSSSTRYINSHLSAGSISSTSDSLRIVGAVVEADAVAIDTGKLTVISLQDASHSQSTSQGINAGVGFGQGNRYSGSIDYQKSESERKWVSEQSGIIGHNSIRVNANDTVLTGGLIANATRDESGRLVDQGNLQLVTDTLTVNDLHDVDRSKTIGGSFGLSLSKVPANQSQGTTSNVPLKNGEAGKKEVPHNTTTIGGIYAGHVTEQTTHATLGGGNVAVGGKALTDSSASELGLAALNRDLTKAQEITKDQDIGGLNATVTVDNRLLTPEGRQAMKREQKEAAKGIVQGAANGAAAVTGVLGDGSISSALGLVNAGAKAGEDAMLAARVKAAQEGQSTDVVDNQNAANDLAALQNSMADLNSTVAVTSETTNKENVPVTETTNTSKQIVYLDVGAQDDLIKLVTHGNAHNAGFGETGADVLGFLGSAVFGVSSWANSDAMDRASSSLVFNTHTLGEQSGLLHLNNTTLAQQQIFTNDTFLDSKPSYNRQVKIDLKAGQSGSTSTIIFATEKPAVSFKSASMEAQLVAAGNCTGQQNCAEAVMRLNLNDKTYFNAAESDSIKQKAAVILVQLGSEFEKAARANPELAAVVIAAASQSGVVDITGLKDVATILAVQKQYRDAGAPLPTGILSGAGQALRPGTQYQLGQAIDKNPLAYPQDMAMDDTGTAAAKGARDAVLNLAGLVYSVADLALIAKNGLAAFNASKTAAAAEAAQANHYKALYTADAQWDDLLAAGVAKQGASAPNKTSLTYDISKWGEYGLPSDGYFSRTLRLQEAQDFLAGKPFNFGGRPVEPYLTKDGFVDAGYPGGQGFLGRAEDSAGITTKVAYKEKYKLEPDQNPEFVLDFQLKDPTSLQNVLYAPYEAFERGGMTGAKMPEYNFPGITSNEIVNPVLRRLK
ncbi:MAG: hemagglutinin repeat-containing protein [Pedobacter sp.]|nr:hemagglutinin repeat-containing protein [Pedobacter sp.]